MKRKNNPKQTVENIISVSAKLFIEKGYDKTSMQDIVDASGMSKGAIFHYFKSKEEIFNTVMSKQSAYVEEMLNNYLNEMQALTAKEKMIGILEKSLNDQQSQYFNNIAESRIQSPHFIVANMQTCINKNAPFFAKIMEEGKEDGSITTDFPEECAEVFFLLLNIWCDHIIFQCDIPRLNRRLKVLQQIMKNMGADIISDELIEKHTKFLEKLYGGT